MPLLVKSVISIRKTLSLFHSLPLFFCRRRSNSIKWVERNGKSLYKEEDIQLTRTELRVNEHITCVNNMCK